MAGQVSDENVVLQKLHEFQSKGNYCDVTVTVGGVRYTCHKNVLAAMSGYFDQLFNSEFSENEAPNISSEEVVAVFELVLLYMYTGKIQITLEKAYKLLIASDYLVMKELKEHCMKFIEQNPTVEHSLKIYYFAASPSGDSQFAKIAMKNVAHNFSQISKTNDFLNIQFAVLESILMLEPKLYTYFCNVCGEVLPNQNYQSKSSAYCKYCNYTNTVSLMPDEELLFPTISDWIKHNVVERLQYFPKLAKFANLDKKYVNKWESLISEYTTELTSQLCPSTVVNQFVKQSIHLYTITENHDLASVLWNNTDNCWILYDHHKVPFDRVKALVVGEKQYFLSYKSSEDIVNQLWVCEKQGQWSELQSPPVFGTDYALASISNTVYLYMGDQNQTRKYEPVSCVDSKAETGSGLIYTYVVDLNKWLITIPPVPKILSNSYFVSTNMLFIIGRTRSCTNDGDTKEKIMLCFDPRTSQWSERTLNVELTFEGKACSYGNKIFICEVMMNEHSPSSKTRNVYIYDVILDQWQTITGIDGDAADVGALVVHDDRLWILPRRPRFEDITETKNLTSDDNDFGLVAPANDSRGSVKTYNLKTKLWNDVPDIPSSANSNDVDCEILEIMDALVF